MKASIVGIVLIGIAWFVAQIGKYYNDLVLIVCVSAPTFLLGILVYFYKNQSKQKPLDFRIPKRNRLPDEEHLPQWVVNTHRKMEHNARQDTNWRNE